MNDAAASPDYASGWGLGARPDCDSSRADSLTDGGSVGGVTLERGCAAATSKISDDRSRSPRFRCGWRVIVLAPLVAVLVGGDLAVSQSWWGTASAVSFAPSFEGGGDVEHPSAKKPKRDGKKGRKDGTQSRSSSRRAAGRTASSGLVVIRDYGAERWGSVIQDVTNELNSISTTLPGAPTFVYSRIGEKSCKSVSKKPQPGISICTLTSMPGDADTANDIWRGVRGSLIRIEDSDVAFSYARALVCHEFVHAVSGMSDGPRDRDSCMRGPLDHFGSFDIAGIASGIWSWR